MAKPYWDDLRERVVRSAMGGLSRRKAAEQFKVSVSFCRQDFAAVQGDGELQAEPLRRPEGAKTGGARSDGSRTRR